MYIMAHRGASGYAPENTMSAFQKALSNKVDSIELDVRLTKDKIPVVCHDAHIKRTSNGGKKYIHDLTLEELRKYDFGSWFSSEFEGERIPTLENVLRLIQTEDVKLNIETKNGPVIPEDLEERVVNLVHKYNVEKKVMYSSFDHTSLKRIFTLDSSAQIGLIFHMNLINLFDYVDNVGMKIFSIHPNYFYATEEMINQAHDRNIKVNVYTLDELEWVNKYKRIGVDGVITNRLLNYK